MCFPVVEEFNDWVLMEWLPTLCQIVTFVKCSFLHYVPIVYPLWGAWNWAWMRGWIVPEAEWRYDLSSHVKWTEAFTEMQLWPNKNEENINYRWAGKDHKKPLSHPKYTSTQQWLTILRGSGKRHQAWGKGSVPFLCSSHAGLAHRILSLPDYRVEIPQFSQEITFLSESLINW